MPSAATHHHFLSTYILTPHCFLWCAHSGLYFVDGQVHFTATAYIKLETALNMAWSDASSPALTTEHLQEARSRANSVFIVAGTFLALSWLTLCLRFWVRGRLIRNLGWDDWTMLATVVRLPEIDCRCHRAHTDRHQIVYTVYCTFTILVTAPGPKLMLGDYSELSITQITLMFNVRQFRAKGTSSC